jgi:F-type H+-transporting ATPase subunit gamma
MPNLKDIRRRIKSVKNTQKITQAMKMVAAAKVKRAENRVKAARPYAHQLGQLLQQVLASVDADSLMGQDDGRFAYPELFTQRPVKTVGLLVISADRGLCGAYHATVVRQLLKVAKQYQQQGLQVRYYLVGQKLVQAFKRFGQVQTLMGQMTQITAAPQIQHAQHIAEAMLAGFKTGHIDRIELLSTEFISMISNRVQQTVLFPVDKAALLSDTATQQDVPKNLLIEPDPVTVLNQLLPMAFTNQVYQALLEASASEQASRMTAMSNATKNAGDMINRLSVVYNKARQASITQEILEVVSGASALG